MENRTVAPEELHSWLQAGRALQILDVRKKRDFDADPRMLPRARWKDPGQVAEWCKELPKTTPIVVYCVHGHAVSNGVVDHLRASGFDALLIEGGIEGWKEAGGSTVKKRASA